MKKKKKKKTSQRLNRVVEVKGKKCFVLGKNETEKR
jgi:hypothetical protein